MTVGASATAMHRLIRHMYRMIGELEIGMAVVRTGVHYNVLIFSSPIILDMCQISLCLSGIHIQNASRKTSMVANLGTNITSRATSSQINTHTYD